jgi:hypothetical protein
LGRDVLNFCLSFYVEVSHFTLCLFSAAWSTEERAGHQLQQAFQGAVGQDHGEQEVHRSEPGEAEDILVRHGVDQKYDFFVDSLTQIQ